MKHHDDKDKNPMHKEGHKPGEHHKEHKDESCDPGCKEPDHKHDQHKGPHGSCQMPE